MKIDLKETEFIDIFADENNNIVIFPCSISDIPIEAGNFPVIGCKYYSFHANHPIELKFPYTKEELCAALIQGFEQWNKYPYFYYKKEKKTLEEEYCGIKGFKNAMRGKHYISARYDPKKAGR